MSNEDLTYFKEYEEFMRSYQKGGSDAEAVGIMIMKQAYYFAQFNTQLAHAGRNLALVARNFELQKDEVTLKALSSSKAKVLTDATQENFDFDLLRSHRDNTEQFINSLKSLLRGLTNEMAYSGAS